MAEKMVGGAFLSASLEVLFDKMVSGDVLDFFHEKKLNQELLKKMKMKFFSAYTVLNDAEEKQIWDPTVKEWLLELQETIYDAEDLVQKIIAEALRCKMEDGSERTTRQVLNLITILYQNKLTTTTFSEFKNKIEEKMEEILVRLEHILEQKDALGLKKIGVQKRLPSTCLVQESGVYGREVDKETIIGMLLSDEISNYKISVIPIVGMAGIGKTTLAQLVYEEIDSRVMERPFDIKVWVSVSNEFDVLGITKEIAERVTSRTFDVLYDKDLRLLRDRLREGLKGKKFLLILDGVLNENPGLWHQLRGPFPYGAYGSKIILTTRNENLASAVCNVPPYMLQTISDEDCWELFVKIAFHNADAASYPELQDIGRGIVEKCQGLPLAVKALGSLLRHQFNPEEWEKILNSEMWELAEENINIHPALWFSYQYLPPHLKRCFAYCSIFPKRHQINKEDLIKLWLADDLLHAPENKRVEEVGEEYFCDLLSRSLLQQSKRSDGSVNFTMPDLVNDLATFIAGEFCLRLFDGDVRSKIRHLSQVRNSDKRLLRYEHLHGAECLRTLLLSTEYHDHRHFEGNNSILENLLPTITCLRVLSLRGRNLTELPDSIGNLKLLRYLNLSNTAIKEIPSTVCTLYNLQMLLLSSCKHLKLLPTNIGSLINLRHLDITSTNLMEMPLEIGNLKDLQTLTGFVLGRGSGCSIKSLRNLQNLNGSLCLSGLENVVDVEDVLVVNLKDKKYLNELKYCWNPSFFEYQNHREVLNGLQPHTNLKVLRIENYIGQQFPEWLGDHSFCNIEWIHLQGCEACSLLPPLGQLPFLRKLEIENFHVLEKIGDEFYHGGSSVTEPFRCLEFLKLGQMKKLKEWSFIGDEAAFPHLKELVLDYCPELTGGLCLSDMLEVVEIVRCHKLEFPINHCYASLRSLNISASCHSVKSIPLDNFPKLNKLVLSQMDNLESLAFLEEPRPALHFLTDFILGTCPKFVSFPQGGLPAPKMKAFSIYDCKSLSSLPEQMEILLPCLLSLELSNCPELESFPEWRLPSNIRVLSLSNCSKLFQRRVWWDLQRLTSLKVLRIADMGHVLDTFPEEGLLPNSLTELILQNLPHLKDLNRIAIQHLNSLKRLAILGCNELRLSSTLPVDELEIRPNYLMEERQRESLTNVYF